MSPSPYAKSARRLRPGASLSDDRGLTLIELLVSMLLLGIILSAAASSLIQFGRVATDNERRVQATALVNRVQEELQALAWQDAAVYEDDLRALLDAGFPGLTDATPRVVEQNGVWTFDGAELVVLDGPGTTERRAMVPRVLSTVDDQVEEHAYRVVRLVTWSDREPGVKRFTTFVSWDLYEKERVEMFVSERAPTIAEAGDPLRPRIIQFQMGPSPMALGVAVDQPSFNSGDINVTVRFSEGVDKHSATLMFASVTAVTPDLVIEQQSVPLTAYLDDPDDSTLAVAFRTTLKAGAFGFQEGTWPFKARATLAGDEYRGTTSMRFIPPSAGDSALGPVTITSASLSRTFMCNDVEHRFTGATTLSVMIDGLDREDYFVEARYTANGQPRTGILVPAAPDTFSTTGALFHLELAKGVDHEFRPPNGANGKDQTDFVITASRSSDGDGDVAASEVLTVVRQSHNSGSIRTDCPS